MKDQLNSVLNLKKTPKRIVSLVPSQTELLYDLGLESSLVGITKFCVHPHHLISKITIVGGTKQVHFDKIKALNPDIILCNKEENTQDMMVELEKIAPVHLSDMYTVDDCLELIEMYGFMFLVENKANDIISEIKNEQQKFQAFIKDQPKLKTAYFIWKKPWMVAANNTFINALLSIGKFENYFEHLERYPEIDLEKDLDSNIDVIMLSTEPFPFKEVHIEAMKLKYPKVRVLLVDGELFSWYGSRLTKSFQYFKKLRLELL